MSQKTSVSDYDVVDYTRRVAVVHPNYTSILYGLDVEAAEGGVPMRDNYRFDGIYNAHERHSTVDTNVVCLQGRIL